MEEGEKERVQMEQQSVVHLTQDGARVTLMKNEGDGGSRGGGDREAGTSREGVTGTAGSFGEKDENGAEMIGVFFQWSIV